MIGGNAKNITLAGQFPRPPPAGVRSSTDTSRSQLQRSSHSPINKRAKRRSKQRLLIMVVHGFRTPNKVQL